ncbi:MAG: hypothetical protein AAF441_21360 [Pseudomonadota bacterium]
MSQSVIGTLDSDTGREKTVHSVAGYLEPVTQILGYELGLFLSAAGSGIMISPRHVLTAAHIFEGFTSWDVNLGVTRDQNNTYIPATHSQNSNSLYYPNGQHVSTGQPSSTDIAISTFSNTAIEAKKAMALG